jgi:hypothetical protein
LNSIQKLHNGRGKEGSERHTDLEGLKSEEKGEERDKGEGLFAENVWAK